MEAGGDNIMGSSLPKVHARQMIGLLEVLEDFKDKADVAKVADDLMLELDDLLPAVEAAELLGFLRVDAGDLILTDEGKHFLSKGSSGRKKILNKIVANLGVFKAIIKFIKSHDDGEVAKEELLDFLRGEMPDVDAESIFHWIVEWGRYSLILRYDSNSGKIRLIKDVQP